jgi:hypothetical protein
MVVISVNVFQMEWLLCSCHKEHATGNHFHKFKIPYTGSTGMPVESHECLICGKFIVSFVLYKNRSLENFQLCEGHIIQKLKSNNIDSASDTQRYWVFGLCP